MTSSVRWRARGRSTVLAGFRSRRPDLAIQDKRACRPVGLRYALYKHCSAVACGTIGLNQSGLAAPVRHWLCRHQDIVEDRTNGPSSRARRQSGSSNTLQILLEQIRDVAVFQMTADGTIVNWNA